VLPEIIIAFGAVPTAKYATPGTPAGADVVKDLVRDHDAIVLDRHGALTLGATADAAFARLEQLEHAARTIAIARQIGGEGLATLDADEIARLHELRRAYYGL
jgi:L-fuculose-phosphate aldolase